MAVTSKRADREKYHIILCEITEQAEHPDITSHRDAVKQELRMITN